MQKAMAGGVAALGAILLVGPAYSLNTKSASSAYAYEASDASCVLRDWGKLRNSCPSQRYFDIPVETRATGNKTFSVYGRSSSSSNFELQTHCAAIIYNAAGAEPAPNKWTFFQQLTTSSGWKTLNGSPLTVATNESVVFECLLPHSEVNGTASGYVATVRGF